MGLDEYRRKRDFQKTSEPSGKRGPKRDGKLTFFVQKHDASHLHYDFRLELNGALAVNDAMLDGEAVAVKPDGTTSFQALQNVFQTGRTGELVYYVFDI